MFIKVRLLKGFPEPLLYSIPKDWDKSNLVGKIIKVPIRAKTELAIIEDHLIELEEKVDFKIKPAIAIEQFPQDRTYFGLINQLGKLYQIDPINFLKRIRQFILEKKVQKIDTQSLNEEIENKENQVTLTEEQQKICDFLLEKITKQEYTPTLLHGVTGSGKTEIYKKLIIHALEQQKTALLLLPEVTLALQFEKLLRQTLPNNIEIFGFHSACTMPQKRDLWQALIQNKNILIIGVHLPTLLPISNLGLIIVDEEHEVGYQEKKHPKINTKEAALIKAKLNNIPILLGSATPSIASLNNVKAKGWNFFQLKKRFSGAFAQIEVVNLNDKKQRKSFWISTKLENLIRDRLEKKEQIIIFINRRGFSFFVQCKNCNFIFKCSSCSVSLTLHKDNWLYCHYCGMSMQYPKQCTQCKCGEDQFIKKGIGTEHVVTILEKLFPNAKIARADLNTTVKKKLWHQTVEDFKSGKINILVGTQTITKGYHFPNVTLVGIIWADINLHFPMYNASETCLQQLIQVAGRAGRQSEQSNVIVQTMLDHPIYEYLCEVEYLKFYNYEMNSRNSINYPPAIRLVEIELKHSKEQIVEEESEEFVSLLLNESNEKVQILGPTKPPVEKIKNKFMRKIYIKGKNLNDIIDLFGRIETNKFKSQIYFTPNPIN